MPAEKRSRPRRRTIAPRMRYDNRRHGIQTALPNDVAPRNPGQSSKIKISVAPDYHNMRMACAAFVLYALTRGYKKSNALPAFLGLLVLLKNSMANGTEPMKKAPRLWWALSNAVRPKSIVVDGQEFGFEFDTKNVNISGEPIFNGVILGPVTDTDVQGLFAIDTTNGSVPELQEAADAASNLFASYPTALAPMPPVEDYIRDCSAFAWKAPLFSSQNPSDQSKSQYSACFLEVPITSYFGYMGLALSRFGESDTPRIPKQAEFAQGHAGNHLGFRLHFPNFQSKQFVRTKMNFKPVDLESWLTNDVSLRTSVYETLTNAGRTSGAGPLPDAYVNISNNQALLYRALNFSASMLSQCGMWFGASQRLTAMSVGTNNLDPFATTSLTESYVSIASVRQLQPIYKKQGNCVTVPFPVISEEAITLFWSFHGRVYPATEPTYGDNTLDLLNSTIGSDVVSWIDGPDVRDDKGKVKGADARYQNQLPTCSPLSIFAHSSTRNTLTTKSLVIGESSLKQVGLSEKEAALRVLRLKYSKEEAAKRYATMVEMLARNKANRVAMASTEKGARVLAAARTSPSTLGAQQVAIVSEVPIDITHAVETMMQMPVSCYEPSSSSVEIERIVNGGVAAYETGGMTAQSFWGDQMSTATTFVKDPTSTQGSEASEELLNMSKGISKLQLIPTGFDTMLNQIGPIASALGKAVQLAIPLGKQAAAAIRKRRATKKAQKKK